MRPRYALSTALILTATAAFPALAQSAGSWSLIAESGGCKVSFLDEAVDDGIFFVDRGDQDCGPDVGRITGYALNEDGATVVFYSTLEGVELIGQVSRSEDGIFTGKLRKGDVLRLEHLSGPRGITDPSTGLRTGEDVVINESDPEDEADAPLSESSDPTSGCLTYAESTDCVAAEDLGPPDGGQMQVMTRMNMRDQGTTSGSSVIGRVEAGSCVATQLCAEDGSGRLWCSIQSDAGAGFILKQDESTVYAKNSCE